MGEQRRNGKAEKEEENQKWKGMQREKQKTREKGGGYEGRKETGNKRERMRAEGKGHREERTRKE